MKMGTILKAIGVVGGFAIALIGGSILRKKSKEISKDICEAAHIEEPEKQEKVEKACKVAGSILSVGFVMKVGSLVYGFSRMVDTKYKPIKDDFDDIIKETAKKDPEFGKFYDYKKHCDEDPFPINTGNVVDMWEQITPCSFFRESVAKYSDNTYQIHWGDDVEVLGDEAQHYYDLWKKYVPENEWKSRKAVKS